MEMSASTTRTLADFVFENRRHLITLVVVLSLITAFLELSRPVLPHEAGPWLSGVGWMLLMTGIMVRLWASLYIARNRDMVLVDRGPYSIVRNPLYLGNLLAAAGIGFLSHSLFALIVLLGGLVFVYLETIDFEDRKLSRLFGDAFAEYSTRVPRLIPRWAQMRALTASVPDTIVYANFGREVGGALKFIAAGAIVSILVSGFNIVHW